MKYKGIIFDFNGTLLLDSPWHEEAWLKMAEEFTGNPLSIENYHKYVHGRTNQAILSYLLGRTPDEKELDEMQERKETYYRNICISLKNEFCLAPGVRECLEHCNQLNLPITIATGSYWGNVKFFIEQLKLDQWFDTTLFVFDDNSFPGKPAPDIFIKAASKLSLKPEDCIVFEDSLAGVKAAHAAKIGKVFTVEPSLKDSDIEAAGGVCQKIQGFVQLDLIKILS